LCDIRSVAPLANGLCRNSRFLQACGIFGNPSVAIKKDLVVMLARPSRCTNVLSSKRETVEPALWLLAAGARVALCLVAGSAQAQTAFSSGWFAAKGAAQQAAAARPSVGGLPGMTPPLAQQQKANAQLQRSIQTLNNTVAAIAAQQAAQAAGRAAALGTVQFVTDGLGEGGLKVDNSLTQGWQNAGPATDPGRRQDHGEDRADRRQGNPQLGNLQRRPQHHR
jgi:hypothetical protein